jgi:hypothetical protein
MSFDERRIEDPQAVINDLLSQQRRQAKTIREQRSNIEKLELENKKLNQKLEKK